MKDLEELKKHKELAIELRVLHDDVINDKVWVDQYYCSFLSVLNRGGLTLVSPDVFEVGRKLLRMIREKVTNVSISKLGKMTLAMKCKEILNDKSLKEEFDRSRKDYDKYREFYDSLYKRIVVATFNARAKSVTKKFKEVKAGRYAKNSCDSAFRAELKTQEKSKCQEVRKRQKKR